MCAVLVSQDAGLPLPGVDLPNKEDVRPDVFVMNQANAHAGKYQPLWTHKRWIDDFVKYIDGGKMLTNPPSVPGDRFHSIPQDLVLQILTFIHLPTVQIGPDCPNRCD